jgi:hypothetical protein
MKIRYNNPKGNIPKEMLDIGYFPTSELHLSGETIYTVYGIMIWKNVLHYLIIPTDELLPSWIPAMLFEIVDQRLPFEWYFRYLYEDDPTGLKIEVGYKELIHDETHFVDLIERDKKAIRIFLDRKREIDEES